MLLTAKPRHAHNANGGQILFRRWGKKKNSPYRTLRYKSHEGVTQIVFVAHVADCTKVVVMAIDTFPPHSFDAVTFAGIADYIGVFDTCKK